MSEALEAAEGRRVLIDKYLEGREVEVDAVCDGESVLIPGIMEHIERAGVHSGDSMAIYPGLTLSEEEVNTILDYTTRIGLALQVRGLMNIQYVVVGGPAYRSPGAGRDRGDNGGTEVYVLEVNPRASRTIPFISKVTGVPMVRLGVGAMLGQDPGRAGLRGRPVEKAGPGRGQGARVLHVQAVRGRYLPWPRDEVHRRGYGDRPRLPRSGSQGSDRVGADDARRGLGPAEHRGTQQGRVGPDDKRPGGLRVRALRNGGHGGNDRGDGHTRRGRAEAP